jgi:hypothetical protein
MEPIRPQVDAFLLGRLRRAPLQRKWFFEERDGNCPLAGEFAVQLSETSKIWRQALGPLAEWIARSLWSTTSRPSRPEPPATRLTQNRKREAKGIPVRPVANHSSRMGNAVPPELTFSRSKLVRLARFDTAAQSRRSESQRRQAAARKSWSPTQKPDWLTRQFHSEQIQPRLLSVQLVSLQSVLSVSESIL